MINRYTFNAVCSRTSIWLQIQQSQAARRGLLSEMTINNHHYEKQVSSPQLNGKQAACAVAQPKLSAKESDQQLHDPAEAMVAPDHSLAKPQRDMLWASKQFCFRQRYQPGSILLTITSSNASPIRSTFCGLTPRAPQSDGELTIGS